MARSLPVCDRHTAIIWALVLIGLAPALYLHLIHAINYDIAWLAIAAERLLQGGSMLRDAYEPNPPLSIIFMMPPVLLSWITPLPLYICTTLYSTIIIFGSTLLCHALLRRLDFLDRHDVNIFCAAYLCAMIVFPSIDYGERDHLVLAGVMPFMLWQIAFTFKRPLPPRLTSAILIVGPLFVLLKPHFGLLPTLLLLHRTIIQRRLFSIIRDPDFIALAVGVVIYITVTLLFFNDYVTQILPAVLSIYIGMRETGLFELTAFYAAMVAVFAFLYIFLPVEPRRRYFVLFLFAAALCCLVPYTVQGKNYWYHLVPALAVYYTALALMARTVLAHYIPRALPLQSVLLAILLVAGAYGFMPLNTKYPDHAALRALPLTQRVAACPEPCTFFMFNNNIGIMHNTALYADRPHGSRFASFWFLPGILHKIETNAPDGATARTTYSQMLATDFDKYKPQLLFIGRFALKKDSPEIFDFGAFFAADPTFAAQWRKYNKTGTITTTNADYYAGTALDNDNPIIFDIYERQK